MLKYFNLVDFVKIFPTIIHLQKSASLKPRASISKSGGDSKMFDSLIGFLNYESLSLAVTSPRISLLVHFSSSFFFVCSPPGKNPRFLHS